jgi:uncharacterized membrane protein
VALGVLAAATLAIATAMTAAGAWPAAIFGAAVIVLAGWLLQRNVRDARATERLRLTDTGLAIVRTDRRGGRTETVLPTAWLKVRLLERPGRTPALILSGHGHHVEVAGALGEAEKRDLATALTAALHRHRSPRLG